MFFCNVKSAELVTCQAIAEAYSNSIDELFSKKELFIVYADKKVQEFIGDAYCPM